MEPKAESAADAELTRQIERAREDEKASRSSGRRKKRQAERTRGVKQVHHQREVPEPERHCELYGKPKRRLGEDVTRMLEFIPGHFVEHVYHLEK